ncbi:hypothetical protein B0T22DRAFT_273795 [Podospora appendiculata]|uniref:Uncharacterized protein n=1 Tax=Podospora appendiculata TaxID=314037 RepID=A0AAE0X4F9_9PEZI|nr:hypothetical protein B0T22DRAFT_273795 [Podospora appendiculata]
MGAKSLRGGGGTGWLARICLAKTSFVLFLLIYATDSGGGVGCLDRKLDWNFRNIGDWAELVHFLLVSSLPLFIFFMSSDLLFFLGSAFRRGWPTLYQRREPRAFYIIFSSCPFFRNSQPGFCIISSQGNFIWSAGRSVSVASIVSFSRSLSLCLCLSIEKEEI